MSDSTAALPRNAVVGVIGAGAMGSGIAQVAAAAGHSVRLFDVRTEALPRAVAGIAAAFDKLATKGRLGAEAAHAAGQRVQACDSLAAMAGCALVIEAVAENLDIKRQLFADLESGLATDAILATNTSSISITAIGAALKRPQQLVGMHFFNPAPLMALVEVVSGLATAPAVAATVHATASAWGKHAVHTRSTPGFIVNRVARPYYAEALRLLTEGAADPATLDAVMREAGGFRMGPFELMDMIGHDVNYAVTRSVFDAFYGDPRFAPSLLQLELVNAGHLGRKSGRGFYDHGPGAALASARTAAPIAPPAEVLLHGASVFAEALATRLQGGAVRPRCFADAGEAADGRVASVGEAALFVSDGRSAAEVARDIGRPDVLVADLLLDPVQAKRVGVARAASCSEASAQGVIGLLQAAGLAVSELADLPALALLRTVAMLASEAADAVHQQVCREHEVDTAMRFGVNYPLGPLAWADRLGVPHVLKVLDRLAAFYGDGRYRASPLMRLRAASGLPLHPTR